MKILFSAAKRFPASLHGERVIGLGAGRFADDGGGHAASGDFLHKGFKIRTELIIFKGEVTNLAAL